MRNRFVVVNLAPGSVRKVGSGFDLPIALGFLIATGQIEPELVFGRLCVGELSLDGSVKAIFGQLAYERIAAEQGLGLMTGPTVAGVFTRRGQEHVCLEHLSDLREGHFVEPEPASIGDGCRGADYSDIAGNDMAKRALQIAAAVSHGLLMIGPPGSGKTMLASRLPSILPPLSEEERVESALIHSVAGLPFERILQGERPFRAPHHGASRAGLIGGGNPTRAGEVSLAHNGVLFLDELAEFGSSVLQLLRQPMEQEFVTLARANGTVTFPARFMLVAASNPCPCGFYGDPKRACTCTPPQIGRYQGRVGGPLMDRIGIIVDVWRSDAAHVLNTGKGTTSAHLREGVMGARAFAAWRRARDEGAAGVGGVVRAGGAVGAGGVVGAVGVGGVAGAVGAGGAMGAASATAAGAVGAAPVAAAGDTLADTASVGAGAALLAACRLGVKERAALEMMAERYQLSGRGIMGTLAVARTIADLEESERVLGDHLLEAVGFRKNDREAAVA
jgi:magnesium chelatase family protein